MSGRGHETMVCLLSKVPMVVNLTDGCELRLKVPMRVHEAMEC